MLTLYCASFACFGVEFFASTFASSQAGYFKDVLFLRFDFVGLKWSRA